MSAYSDLILSRANLALYWRLGSSGTTDLSGNGRNGTGAGGITIGGVTPGAIVDDADTATDFDGTDDRITQAYDPFVNGTTRSFEGWAYRDVNTAYHVLIGGTGAVGNGPHLRINTGSNDVLWRPDNAGAAWTAAWPGTGQWVHWVLIFNEATDVAELFINGTSQGTHAETEAYGASHGTFEVGAFNPTVFPFDGKMDEIAVYERALTGAEVLEHYEMGINGPPVPPEVVTGAASGVTDDGATLNGTVDANEQATEYYFEYGPSTGYGDEIPVTLDGDAGSGAAPVAVDEAIVGLAASATYHYRLVATNGGGTAEGDDATFTTAALPPSTPVELVPPPRVGAPPPRRRLTWELTDVRGRRAALLTDRQGGEVTIGVNAPRSARVNIPVECEAAKYITPLAARLKVYLDETIIFNGALSTPRLTTEESSLGLGAWQLAAFGPDAQLAASFWGRLADPIPKGAEVGTVGHSDEPPQDIMWDLILEADRWAEDTRGSTPYVHQHPRDPFDRIPGIGIIQGEHTGGTMETQYRSYPEGKQIWEAIMELSEIEGGPDFDLKPIDSTDGTFAQLDTFYPEMGTDKTDSIRLEYGLGRHSASDFIWEPDGSAIVNFYAMVGQAKKGNRNPVYVAECRASQELYGVWQLWESDPDVHTYQRLKQKARAFVQAHAYPTDYFDVTPAVEAGGLARGYRRTGEEVDGTAFSVPPSFGPPEGDFDYWIGDKIGVAARIGPTGGVAGVDVELHGRVTDATIKEVDDAGNLLTDLTCSPLTPAAAVSGWESQASAKDAD